MINKPDEFNKNNTRISDDYVPPFKNRKFLSSDNLNNRDHQEKLWIDLEKNIRGEINKLNISNVQQVLANILKNNIIRGRGILVNCILRAQLCSQTYTDIICCLSAIINCSIPDFGSLLLRRLVNQFRRSYSNGDKFVCKSTLIFMAQLVNHKVVHELTALQVCLFLIEKFTDDSIEVCISFIRECGEFLLENSPQGLNTIMNQLRKILQEGKLKKRTNFLIEHILKERRNGFKNHKENDKIYDLLDPDEQITHFVDILDEEIDIQDDLDNFVEADPKTFEEENIKWEEISKELLSGLDDTNVSEDGLIIESNSTVDQSEKDFVILRKKIYLCIMNSLNFEECTHRLIKLNLTSHQTNEACTMILDCCSMERTYQKFFSLVAERLCLIRKEYQESFKQLFSESYETAHRLETNRLRHVTKFYSYLLSSSAIPWSVLSIIKLSEEDTASSSRIFIKILFQELSNNMGIKNLNVKLNSIEVLPYTQGIFPEENISKIKFSINFFTAIGLSAITQKLKERLSEIENKQLNKFNELYFGSGFCNSRTSISHTEEIIGDITINTERSNINLPRKKGEQINVGSKTGQSSEFGPYKHDTGPSNSERKNTMNYGRKRDRSFSREI
ncbi:NIC+MI domains containing protein [Cryptosporidium canis]|uniref:NIC+MI domains containing protein n=1 Tax=Cryptosporidium canis TaxID=195482 RepID=A0ABQ8PBD6_9CRYT|nr:NIC+MI domains containing protein [Cryptosporidium canis]KAJ1615135.1 NIC+MI domains containing protein [Cryptosporidium canis]